MLSGRPLVALTVAVGTAIGACASESGPAADALDADTARDRLSSSCIATTAALDALSAPTDDASRSAWTADVATALERQAIEVRGLVLLDDEQRSGFRAFADNTAAQAAAWGELGVLLGSGADLEADGRVSELTTEIAELSLGRDDLSDELGVAVCRRGAP